MPVLPGSLGSSDRTYSGTFATIVRAWPPGSMNGIMPRFEVVVIRTSGLPVTILCEANGLDDQLAALGAREDPGKRCSL